MSKKMLSTLLLFLICAGFGLYSLITIFTAHDSDTVIQGLLYLLPAVVALIALLRLPFKSDESETPTETQTSERKESETRA
jgi:hypothetical protein